MAHVEINTILHLKQTINVDKYRPKGHGRRKDFSRGGTRGIFQIFSRGWPKVMKFVFPTRNYENNLFCRNFQNPRGPWTPAPPSDDHAKGSTWTQHG